MVCSLVVYLIVGLLANADWKANFLTWHERLKLQGTWKIVRWEEAGKSVLRSEWWCTRARFTGNQIELRGPNGNRDEGECELCPSKSPHAFRLSLNCHEGVSDEGKQWIWYGIDQWFGIYRLECDRLKICITSDIGYGVSGWPAEFSTQQGDLRFLITLEREKP